MPSRDSNHVTVMRAFEAHHGCTVVDTSNLGDGIPDLLVGYGGQSAWVETKVAATPKGKQRPSTRCGTCKRTYPAHQKAKKGACAAFQRVYVAGKPGRVSTAQQRFDRWWTGCPIAVVHTEAEADALVGALRSLAHLCEGAILGEAPL